MLWFRNKSWHVYFFRSQPCFFFSFPDSRVSDFNTTHVVLNGSVINNLICVKHAEVWKAANYGTQKQPSSRATNFFSSSSGWRAPHSTFNRKAALFFFSFSPLYFFVRLPAPRRPFSFPTSAEEQGPKFRVVVCRSRAFGNAPPLRFSQVVWTFFAPSEAFLALTLFGLWSSSEAMRYHEAYGRD